MGALSLQASYDAARPAPLCQSHDWIWCGVLPERPGTAPPARSVIAVPWVGSGSLLMQTRQMAVTFECKTTIEASQTAVFDLSLSVDAHLESMAGSKERAIAGITAGSISLGEEVTWRAVHFGLPFRMTSRVTELERRCRATPGCRSAMRGNGTSSALGNATRRCPAPQLASTQHIHPVLDRHPTVLVFWVPTAS